MKGPTEKPVTRLENESAKEQAERWIAAHEGLAIGALVSALTYLEFQEDKNGRLQKQLDWFVNDSEPHQVSVEQAADVMQDVIGLKVGRIG